MLASSDYKIKNGNLGPGYAFGLQLLFIDRTLGLYDLGPTVPKCGFCCRD